MNLSSSIIARSDQLNADDLVSGPRTFTVAKVEEGNAEQPCKIFLAEWPGNRPFKPSKTAMRVLAYAWGEETDDWPAGARMTLFRDSKVKWAGVEVGGIRIKALSHIKEPFKIALQESKGKKTLHEVDRLPDAPAPNGQPTPEDLAQQVVDALKDAMTEAEVREWGNRAAARNLLDVQVNAQTVRSHVEHRLAELTEVAAADVKQAGAGS